MMHDLTMQTVEAVLLDVLAEGSKSDHQLSDTLLADVAYTLYLIYTSRGGEA